MSQTNEKGTAWYVHVQKLIPIADVTQITQYYDQGWQFHGLDAYHSMMMVATNTFTVKAESIVDYVDALKSCADFVVTGFGEII